MHTEGLYNREPSPSDNPIEHEANVFASRLLAPACVLWGLGVTTPEQISEICGISLTAAEFRMERMDVLYKRNKFLISLLERRVYERFLPYISKNKL
jgi:Zn-dependent peptidase ImmA (M78 family)